MAEKVDYFKYGEDDETDIAVPGAAFQDLDISSPGSVDTPLSPIIAPNSPLAHHHRKQSTDNHHEFVSKPSERVRRRHSSVAEKERWVGINLTPMYTGIAVVLVEDTVMIGLSIHDGTYSIDYSIENIALEEDITREQIADIILKYVIVQLVKFSTEHLVKFVGAGLTQGADYHCPQICGTLWSELDIVPMVFHVRLTLEQQAPAPPPALHPLHKLSQFQQKPTGDKANGYTPPNVTRDNIRGLDEQADSAARKALMYFGPNHNPRLAIGFRNQVDVDSAWKVKLISNLTQYEKTVHETTWRCVMKYSDDLKKRKIKIAFFNSTPQGGGVALMRHAMMRFYKTLGVDAKWYVPKPNPQVFRTTKTNHNILQGVQAPGSDFAQEQQDQFSDWITYNAKRYWLSEGGPLAEGGADVVIIDDPQMPGLIPLIKESRPQLPIIYRSHIEIRGDLVLKEGSLQAKVWNYLWDRIQGADIFISHPVNSFVPGNVPIQRVGLMPASTDWLDGLSKTLREWDLRYYFHNFRTLCSETRMYKLAYPARDYIVQVARFDPSKGIPTVIETYAKLRRKLDNILPNSKTPQLLICGHGAVDDPDASIIYDEIIAMLDQDEYQQYAPDIVVMRIPPSDQLLNALLSSAKVGLQLSSREGFEVKVSECLHKGIPIIATKAGGIPLQVQHGKNGFLVDVGDSTTAAKYLYQLWTDKQLYKKMSDFAKVSVSDEVGTVGNALLFMYMATKLAGGGKLQPEGKWVCDMMREDAGEKWQEGEPRLPRSGIHVAADSGRPAPRVKGEEKMRNGKA